MSMCILWLAKYLDQSNQSDIQKKLESEFVEASPNLGRDFSFQLSTMTTAYEVTNNSLYLFEIIKLCHEHKVYPPEFVMEKLALAIDEWRNSAGKKNFEQILGMKRKGQRNPYTKNQSLIEQNNAMQEMWQLVNVFGISVEEAAIMA